MRAPRRADLASLLGLALLVAGRGAFAQCSGALFQAPVRYEVSASAALRLADLDGDGALDVVTSGNQVDQVGVVSILANRGNGAFAPERPVATGFGQRIEDVADVDRDGIADLLLAEYWQNGMAVARGLGAFAFAAGVPHGTATHGGPTRALDIDGDGVLDVVSLSFGSGNPVRVHLFRGRADGTLEPKQTFTTDFAVAASPSVRFIAGSPELVFSERSGHLGLIRFVNGGIALTRLDAGPGFDLAALFADVNGDGIDDVIDLDDGGLGDPLEGVFVRLATAAGGFLPRQQLPYPRTITLPTTVRAADFDGDGRLDLVVNEFRGPTLHLFRGDGTGHFAAGVPIDAAGPVNDFVAGDVNGDGRPDLVTVNNDRTVSVVLNATKCPPARRRTVRH